jgi:cysteine desulfurase
MITIKRKFLALTKSILPLTKPSFASAQTQNMAIYLDNQSTTPLDFRVLDSMLPHMTSAYGNPHSKSHEFGWQAENAIENARAQVATLIGSDKKELIFVSGATEANN